jgi:thiamine pyrophosphate-dependent acetolactate synthase large subunit-like protein
VSPLPGGPVSGGEALVAALAAHGVEAVFGIPGTHNLAVYAHLRRYGLRHVLTRHEQGAGYAADGYARASGRPGVCLTTSGPAVLNAASAVAQAWSDSVPVLLVSPGMPLRHPGRGNGTLHETRGTDAVLGGLVAHHRVTSVPEIPVAVAQAFAELTGGRPRPVHLEIPYDVLEESAPVRIPTPLRPGPTAPRAPALDRAAARLAAAARPGIIAGGGARTATGPLRAVAERLGAPVVSTANGKGTLPADHPLSLGAGLHHRAVAEFAADCDAVLAVGTELAPTDLWHGPLGVDDRLVRVDVDPAQLVTNAQPALTVVGDAGLSLDGLRDRLGELSGAPGQARAGQSAGQRAGQSAGQRAGHWRERIAAQARAEGKPWLGLVAALSTSLGRDGVLAGDSTMACYYGALTNLPGYAPGGFLYPTGFGTLGYGLPAGIGAKVARPQAPVAVLHGDGGLMFGVAELAAAAQLRLPLPVLVVDNGGYGEIRREMAERGQDVHAVDLGHPDFVGLARALGCHAVRVGAPERLSEVIEDAFAADRPTLVHIPEEAAA